MLEPQAAALAAEAHDSESLSRIEEAYEDMVRCASGELDLIEADLRFHTAILSATRNHFIGAFSTLIHAAMVSTFRVSWRGAEGIREERLWQHGAVAQAIAQRKPKLAHRRMEKLLDNSFEDIREALGSERKQRKGEPKDAL
jgi:DNA-binding FadR family transcriptional regulator